MADIIYNATPSEINPTGVQNTINANYNANSPLSEYALQYGYQQTPHLQQQIQREIQSNIPAQFNVFRLLYNIATENVPSDEFIWSESGIPRAPLTVASQTSNSSGTQVVVLSAGAGQHVSRNMLIAYPDDITIGIVDSVVNDTITLKSPIGVGSLPALASGDILVPQVPLTTDGTNFFDNYGKMVTQEYTNFIGIFQRNKRWTRLMQLKYQSGNATNYYNADMKELATLAYQDAFIALWNGKKANYNLYNGTNYQPAKYPNGIYPTLRDNGALHGSASPTTLVSTFEKLADATNYMNVDEPRFLFGTDKALYGLSKKFKNPIRYQPQNKIADLNLDEYKLGTKKFVPMVTELFKAQSGMFPASWENRIFCLDIKELVRMCITSYQMIDTGYTKLDMKNGGRETYTDFWMQICLSTKVKNINSHFYLDVIGL